MTDVATPPKAPRTNRGEGLTLIWRQLTRAPQEFTLGGLGTLMFALATVASSYVIGWVTDDLLIPAVESGDLTAAALAAAAGAILGVAGVRAAGIALPRFGANLAQYRLQARDRTEVTDRYLTLPLEWHRRHPTGRLLSNVNADVEAASNIAAPLPMALGVVIMLIVTGILLVMTDPFLAAVGLAVLPAIALVNLAFQRRMRIVTTEAQRLRAQVSEIAHESFDAALVVKTLGREGVVLYLQSTTRTVAFGPAGSVVAVLLYTYYSAQVLLFGAAFTWVLADAGGRSITPGVGAVRLQKVRGDSG